MVLTPWNFSVSEMSTYAHQCFNNVQDLDLQDLVVAFGVAVTVQRSGSWVARKGAESIFRAFDILLPQVRNRAGETNQPPKASTPQTTHQIMHSCCTRTSHRL